MSEGTDFRLPSKKPKSPRRIMSHYRDRHCHRWDYSQHRDHAAGIGVIIVFGMFLLLLAMSLA